MGISLDSDIKKVSNDVTIWIEDEIPIEFLKLNSIGIFYFYINKLRGLWKARSLSRKG